MIPANAVALMTYTEPTAPASDRARKYSEESWKLNIEFTMSELRHIAAGIQALDSCRQLCKSCDRQTNCAFERDRVPQSCDPQYTNSQKRCSSGSGPLLQLAVLRWAQPLTAFISFHKLVITFVPALSLFLALSRSFFPLAPGICKACSHQSHQGCLRSGLESTAELCDIWRPHDTMSPWLLPGAPSLQSGSIPQSANGQLRSLETRGTSKAAAIASLEASMASKVWPKFPASCVTEASLYL